MRPFRVGVYSFLSGAFKAPPSLESLESFRSNEFLNLIERVFSADLFTDFREALRDAPDIVELRKGLDQEFVNLFKVPGGQYVTPYESVFRDTREIAGKEVKGLLLGQSALDVRHWYRLARFEISTEYDDLPDHIVLELRYMADICAKEQELEEEGDLKRLERAWEMQRDFLAGHLARWIDDFADRVQNRTRHPYYLTVARRAAEFIDRDLATLEELLGPSEGSSLPHYEPIES